MTGLLEGAEYEWDGACVERTHMGLQLHSSTRKRGGEGENGDDERWSGGLAVGTVAPDRRVFRNIAVGIGNSGKAFQVVRPSLPAAGEFCLPRLGEQPYRPV